MRFFSNLHKDLSDQELIEGYLRDGDERYLNELFHRYAYLVLFLCNKYFDNPDDSRECAMEILEKIAFSLKDQKVVNFKSWLYVITKNFCLNKIKHIKSLHREMFVPIDLNEQIFMQFPDFDCLITENSKSVDALEEAIEDLDKDQKTCLKLFYFEKKSYKEIMELNNWDMNQVHSHLQNARRNIKIYLEKRGINAKTFKN